MWTNFIILYLFVCGTLSAVMHGHTVNLNREREVDGAYSPRDRDHLDGDEHSNEFDHEAILGSVKEAEEFDHLSPEESKKRLSILLLKMDINNDKVIDRKELKAWILRSFKMLSEEEAKERMEDGDENRDGKMSWEEYVEEAYGMHDDEQDLEVDEQLIADDKEMWIAADINNDGLLEDEEWTAFSHPEEHPAMLPFILKQTLREKDTNKDGEIDFQEFVGERAKEHDKDWLQVEKQKFDNEFDKNKDGVLKGNEILSWVVPSNEEIAEEEVDHLFVASDDDHNAVLSFLEIIDHYDIFVGSEATDYGDHLHNIHQFSDEL